MPPVDANARARKPARSQTRPQDSRRDDRRRQRRRHRDSGRAHAEVVSKSCCATNCGDAGSRPSQDYARLQIARLDAMVPMLKSSGQRRRPALDRPSAQDHGPARPLSRLQQTDAGHVGAITNCIHAQVDGQDQRRRGAPARSRAGRVMTAPDAGKRGPRRRRRPGARLRPVGHSEIRRSPEAEPRRPRAARSPRSLRRRARNSSTIGPSGAVRIRSRRQATGSIGSFWPGAAPARRARAPKPCASGSRASPSST